MRIVVGEREVQDRLVTLEIDGEKKQLSIADAVSLLVQRNSVFEGSSAH